MSDVYEQHDAAFCRVSAFVILQHGERVATVAFKLPADGAGRLYAYVHWFGTPMVRGFANGYGYDKRSAACAAAARKMENDGCRSVSELESFAAFRGAMRKDDSYSWERNLVSAGFVVLQAV